MGFRLAAAMIAIKAVSYSAWMESHAAPTVTIQIHPMGLTKK